MPFESLPNQIGSIPSINYTPRATRPPFPWASVLGNVANNLSDVAIQFSPAARQARQAADFELRYKTALYGRQMHNMDLLGAVGPDGLPLINPATLQPYTEAERLHMQGMRYDNLKKAGDLIPNSNNPWATDAPGHEGTAKPAFINPTVNGIPLGPIPNNAAPITASNDSGSPVPLMQNLANTGVSLMPQVGAPPTLGVASSVIPTLDYFGADNQPDTHPDQYWA